MRTSITRSTADVHVPSSNTAAVITYTAVTGRTHALGGIEWSYDGTPTAGNLKIESGGSTIFSADVTTGGPGFIPFDPPLLGTISQNLVITLAAGGSGISGKVNAAHWLE